MFSAMMSKVFNFTMKYISALINELTVFFFRPLAMQEPIEMITQVDLASTWTFSLISR